MTLPEMQAAMPDRDAETIRRTMTRLVNREVITKNEAGRYHWAKGPVKLRSLPGQQSFEGGTHA